MNNNNTFLTDNFHFDGMYLVYGSSHCSSDSKFVARFKHMSSQRKCFQKFLQDHFTPDEYFAQLAKGETPLDTLRQKAYVSNYEKKLLKSHGYSIDLQGYKEYLKGICSAESELNPAR